MNIRLSLFAVASGILLFGCHTYTTVQRNIFADDDGNVVIVDYGRSERDHVNTFVSPATGKEMEFKSKLVVKVELPNGETFKAWRCMNFQTRGTMYETDDGEWKALANGFSFVIYHRISEQPQRYREVYRGVICDTPQIDVKKDDRWHEKLQHGRQYKKPKPVVKE